MMRSDNGSRQPMYQLARRSKNKCGFVRRSSHVGSGGNQHQPLDCLSYATLIAKNSTANLTQLPFHHPRDPSHLPWLKFYSLHDRIVRVELEIGAGIYIRW